MENPDQPAPSILTAYFGISKSKRDQFDPEIEVITRCLAGHNMKLNVFVDRYHFKKEEEKTMMKTAFEEIEKCGFIIVELSKKAIGVGVEVGYAKAIKKPIIYLKRQDAPYSTTVGGTADYFIEYQDLAQLEEHFDKVLLHLKERLAEKN